MNIEKPITRLPSISRQDIGGSLSLLLSNNNDIANTSLKDIICFNMLQRQKRSPLPADISS